MSKRQRGHQPATEEEIQIVRSYCQARILPTKSVDLFTKASVLYIDYKNWSHTARRRFLNACRFRKAMGAIYKRSRTTVRHTNGVFYHIKIVTDVYETASE